MKMKVKILLIGLSIIFSGCQKFFNVENSTSLKATDYYTSADDPISVINGLYTLVQDLVDPLWILGESQGDLVLPARGANSDMYDIAMLRANSTNSYTDPAPFYRLINACNGAIEGLIRLQHLSQDYSEDLLMQHLAEIKGIRCWAYYLVVQIWGDVPFYTNYVDDLSQVKSLPVKPRNEILRSLAQELENATPNIPMPKLLGDDRRAVRFNFATVRYLLGDIYASLGDYAKSLATITEYVQDNNGAISGLNTMIGDYYYLAGLQAAYTTAWVRQYTFQYYDPNSDYRSPPKATTMYYIRSDISRGRSNSLVRWTSNQPGAIYAFKPSPGIILAWNSQAQYEGQDNSVNVPNGNYSDRYRGMGRSYRIVGSDTLIYKYLMINQNDLNIMKNPYTQDMDFILYREAHLFFLNAEMLAVSGRYAQVLGLINSIFRYRVSLMSYDPKVLNADAIWGIILDENALELGFEGTRWLYLKHIAKISNNPKLVATKLASKFPVNQRQEIISRYSVLKNWDLPFNLKNTGANPNLFVK
jgi:hypothetical protein